jgi:hypothetical protein
MKLSRSTLFELFSTRVLSASVLCWLALACWTGSLLLPALGSSTEKRFIGVEALLGGWGAIYFGNFAWLANVWFIWASLRVLAGRKSDGLAFWAFVFSLDAFRLSRYLQNEGGSFAQVYGFGWGAVLWWLAMALIVAASGSLPNPDPGKRSKPAQWTMLKPIGLMLFGIIVIGVTFVAVTQRSTASVLEQKQLTGYAFKRTSVCTKEVNGVRVLLPHLDGPLLVDLPPKRSESLYPFERPEKLLLWGIPSVRIGGRDFRLTHMGEELMLTSSPAKGHVGAILTVRQSGAQLDVDLTTSDGRMAFAQQWLKMPDGKECPEYSFIPKPEQPPRRLLVESLGLAPVAELPRVSQPSPTPGALVARIDSWSNSDAGRTAGCPTNIGWIDQPYPRPIGAIDLPSGFQIGEQVYYPKKLGSFQARCVGHNIYLNQIVSMRTQGLRVLLQKRDSADFRLISTAAIDIESAILDTEERNFRIIDITEQPDGVTLKLVKSAKEPAVLIKANLVTSHDVFD